MKSRHINRWLGFVILVLLLGISPACSARQSLPESSEEEEQDVPVEDESEGISKESEESAAVDENTDGEILMCPMPGEENYLYFDHTLTMNYGEASLTHMLHSGMMVLTVSAAGAQGEAAFSSLDGDGIPYTMEGVMGDCSVELAGEMFPSAQGYCEEGIVYLTIIEDWGAANGTMTCPDGAVPFTIPAGGPQTHAGASGGGEEFLLLSGEEGHTVMRPFLGGEGYHSWTLYPAIELVPLVPEE
ncbi:MAG: hypothetical protein JW750_04280 [Anaerolineaceae bacterium]|nr:hypothetical protein [Anaerolineaceae bacterium]